MRSDSEPTLQPLTRESTAESPRDGARWRAKALDLLSRRDHSVQELRSKLLRRGADPPLVAELLQEFQRLGWLDDRRFAEQFLASCAHRRWGERRLRQELAGRGVGSELVEEAMSAWNESHREQAQDLLLRSVQRELARGRSPEKVIASYLRRGYSYGQLRQALESAKACSDEEQAFAAFEGFEP